MQESICGYATRLAFFDWGWRYTDDMLIYTNMHREYKSLWAQSLAGHDYERLWRFMALRTKPID